MPFYNPMDADSIMNEVSGLGISGFEDGLPIQGMSCSGIGWDQSRVWR